MSHKVDKQDVIWTSTTHQMAKFIYRWEIDNFNFYSKCTAKAFDPDLSVITSPKFSPPNDPTLQFILSLYPKGVTEEAKGHVSLFLKLSSCPKPDVRVQCKMSIFDKENIKQNTVDFLTKLIPNSPGWGFLKYINHERLDALLTNGKLTIFCEIEALLDRVHTTESSICQDTRIESQRSDNYAKLLESGKLSDVVLVARDSTEHRAHKAILTARSPVFGAMFEHDTTERNSGRVLIDDIDGEVIAEMLRFIYTGKVTKLDELVSKLLIAADKYGLELLKDICEKHLIHNLNNETVLSLLIIADRHSAKLLRSKAIEYIKSNIASLIETDNWKAIEDSPKLGLELFKIALDNRK